MRFVLCLSTVFTISFLLQSCYPTSTIPVKVFSPLIMDYPHLETPNQLFYSADSLKWEQKYSTSNKAFLTILAKKKLSLHDSIYCLNQLAHNHLWLNEYEKAKETIGLVEQKLKQHQISLPYLLGDFHFNNGWYLKEKRKGKEAFHQLFRAKTLYDSLYPSPHLRQIEVLNEIGFTYREYSHPLDSCIYYSELAEDLFNQDTTFENYGIKTYFGMAMVSLFTRDHIKGLAAINNCLIATQKVLSDNYILLGRQYVIKANLLKKFKRKEIAEKYLNKAIQLGEISQKNSLRIQEFYREKLIFVAHERDSSNFFKTLNVLLKKYPSNQLIYVNVDRLLGKFHEMNKSYRKAIHYTSKAITAFENMDYPDDLFFQRARYTMARSYLKEEKFDSSTYFFRYDMFSERPKKLKVGNWKQLIPKCLEKNKINFIALGEIGGTFVQKFKKNRKNSNALEQALEIYNIVDSTMFYHIKDDDDVNLVFQNEFANWEYPNAIWAALELFKKKHDVFYFDLANHYMDRLKATIMYQNMVSHPDLPNEILLEEKKLKEQLDDRKSVDKLIDEKKSIITNKELLKVRLQLKRIRNIQKEQFPSYYQKKLSHTIPNYQELKPFLAQTNTSVLQYHIGVKDLVITIQTPDTFAFHINKTPTNFEDIYKALMRAIRDPNLLSNQEATSKFVQNSRKIHDILVKPIIPLLSKKIIILSDGKFDSLPFSCLTKYRPNNTVKFKNYPFLFKEYEISYEYSLKTLIESLKSTTKIPSKPKILAMAYSDFQQKKKIASRKKKGELFYSFEEVNNIKKNYGENCTIFKGRNCTKFNFLKLSKHNWDIIHLAVHAYSDRKEKLNNKIIFRSMQDREVENPLYGFEISNLGLSASLIVLSACQTAEGVNISGEGTYSLSKSFRQTGIEKVIASFWEIDDFSTFQIMDYFYQNLSSGLSPSSSLHKAKIKFLENQNKDLSAPYWWSGLVIFGV